MCAVQAAAADVAAGQTPAVSTIADAREAAVAGVKRILRCDDHMMRPGMIHVLKEDIRKLMDVTEELSVSAIANFLLEEAVAGVGSTCSR